MPVALTFSRSLYLPEAVKAAAAAYEGLATIAVDVQPNDVVVSFSDIEPQHAENLPDAFANHALFETIARLRRAQSAGGAR